MNDVLLINRIIPGQTPNKQRRMTFVLGDMHDMERAEKVIDLLQASQFAIGNNLIVKYNGVEMLMEEENIPAVLRLFMDNDVDVYGVYHMYSA